MSASTARRSVATGPRRRPRGERDVGCKQTLRGKRRHPARTLAFPWIQDYGSGVRSLRSDNWPQFIAQTLRRWLKQVGVGTLYIEPGSPWENGYA